MTEHSAVPPRAVPLGIAFLLPLALVAALVAGLAGIAPGLLGAAPAPIERLTIERIDLGEGVVIASVVNGGPEPVTIAGAFVDEAVVDFRVDGANPLPRLGRARVVVPHHWVEGEPVRLELISSTGVTFAGEVEVATTSPGLREGSLGSLAFLGLLVGVFPVLAGILWWPFIRALDERWRGFLLALAAGVLVYLAVALLGEGLSQAALVPGAYQGLGLLTVSVLGGAIGLAALARQLGVGAESSGSRLALAYLIAGGIGLHNLGEGLAIGSAYALGEVSLGVALVVGFTLHNATEPFAFLPAIARDPAALLHLIGLGLVAGAPTVPGALLGGLSGTALLAVPALGLGAGAIFQVLVEMARPLLAEASRPARSRQLAGLAAGLAIMYLTALLVVA